MIYMVLEVCIYCFKKKNDLIVEVCLPVVGLFISNTSLIDEVLIQGVPFLIFPRFDSIAEKLEWRQDVYKN